MANLVIGSSHACDTRKRGGKKRPLLELSMCQLNDTLSFSGAKTDNILTAVNGKEHDEILRQASHLIILAGGNDLDSPVYLPQQAELTANNLFNIAIKCKEKMQLFSSVVIFDPIPRRKPPLQREEAYRRMHSDLWYALKSRCELPDALFARISFESFGWPLQYRPDFDHILYKDQTHLSKYGQYLLADRMRELMLDMSRKRHALRSQHRKSRQAAWLKKTNRLK